MISIDTTERLPAARRRRSRAFKFRCRDVTDMHDMRVSDIVRGTLSGVVAQTVAARMDLPTNVPWSLRDDRTGTWLKDDVALDAQLEGAAEPNLRLIPKTHLGGWQG